MFRRLRSLHVENNERPILDGSRRLLSKYLIRGRIHGGRLFSNNDVVNDRDRQRNESNPVVVENGIWLPEIPVKKITSNRSTCHFFLLLDCPWIHFFLFHFFFFISFLHERTAHVLYTTVGKIWDGQKNTYGTYVYKSFNLLKIRKWEVYKFDRYAYCTLLNKK